jgi:hypothetical protein
MVSVSSLIKLKVLPHAGQVKSDSGESSTISMG